MEKTKIILAFCVKHKMQMLTRINVVRHEAGISLVYFTRQCLQCENDYNELRIRIPEARIEVLREEEYKQLLKPY